MLFVEQAEPFKLLMSNWTSQISDILISTKRNLFKPCQVAFAKYEVIWFHIISAGFAAIPILRFTNADEAAIM